MASELRLHPQYVTDPEGRRKAVILPVEEFEELLEDLDDFAVAAERRGDATVPHEKAKAELRSDGFLQD
jgi:predicted DNA-binding protein